MRKHTPEREIYNISRKTGKLGDTKRKDILALVITVIFVFAVVYGIYWFNGNVLPRLSGAVRLIAVIVVWWPMLVSTVFFMRRDKESAKDIGFVKDNILWQTLSGVFVAIGALILFIILPALFGLQMSYVGDINALSIIYQLIYMLLAVASIEEIIFRGHLLKKLTDISKSKWLAIIISSALFGLFHIFNWNIYQIVFTTIIGFFFCICKDKIKHCTLLSLIVAHALYNTIHPIFTAFYFG
jgi:membrane protease YdiL (CAAX protease family)